MKVQKACIHAFYTRANDGSGRDLVFIKERVKAEDGSETINLDFRYDVERPFYITKKEHRRTHSNKKEYEILENLNEYKSTQSDMPRQIDKILNGGRSSRGYVSMRDVSESPYVYGTDISVTSLIKQSYLDRWPTYQPEASVATLDLETNVLSEREEIIYGCCTYKENIILAVNGEWLGDVLNAEEQIQTLFKEYLSEYIKDRNLKLHIRIEKNDLGVVERLFKFLHHIKPDFVSIWNMAFDVEKIVQCLDYYHVDPRDIFCDPEVPVNFRSFYWKKDSPKKVKADGKTISKHIAELWHVVNAPASFYIIDSMCYFKISRVREQARQSYSLDSILDEELKLSKLKFKEADAYVGLEWHKFLQTNYKLHYGIYNIFDCIALELLDEKTHDLSVAVLAGAGSSDLSSLTSNPKTLANELHFFLQKQGKIISATSSDMTEELDKFTLDKSDWILTLSSDLSISREHPFISDLPGSDARLYSHVFDLDISSGYPTTGVIMNVSKETTLVEVSEIEGLSERQQRRAGVNMTAVRNNSIDLGQTLYNLPSMSDMLKGYKASLTK